MGEPLDTSNYTPDELEQARLANIGSGQVQGAGVPLATGPSGQFQTEAVPPEPPPAVSANAAAPAAPPKYVSQNSGGGAGNPFAVVANVPGQSQTTSVSTDLGPEGKAAAAESAAAFKKQEGAQAQLGEISRQRAEVVAGDAAARVSTAEQHAKVQAAQSKEMVDRSNAELQKMQKGADDYDRSVKDLDPDRWWARQSTGQRIGNLIAIALGGIGAALQARGGYANAHNTVLEQINREIDRDIDMQKAALQAKDRGLNIKQNMFMAVRAHGATVAEAEALTRAAAQERAASQFQAAAAKLGPGEAQARAQADAAQLQQQAALTKQQFAERVATRVSTTATSTPVTAGQMQAAGVEQQRKDAGLVPYDPKLQTPIGQVADETTKRTVAEKYLEYKRFNDHVTKLEAMVKSGYMDRALSPKKRQDFAREVSGVTNFLASKDFANTGANMTPEEYNLKVKPFLPGGTAWDTFFDKDANSVKGLRELADHHVDTLRQVYGVKTHL
jgi:hypothetical protein